MEITPIQLDILQELLNIGVGHAAGSLNEMLDQPIRLHIPHIRLGNFDELRDLIEQDIPGRQSSVQLPFRGQFSGSTCLLFPTKSAAALVAALTGYESDLDCLNSMIEATLTEIGNIVLNGVMGSLVNMLEHQIQYSVPFYEEISIQQFTQSTSSDMPDVLLWAQTRFTIDGHNISGDILVLMGIHDLGLLLQAISRFAPSADPVRS